MNIKQISPATESIKVYEIITLHNGNINIDFATHIATGVEIGGDIKLINSYGEQKYWYREKQD